MIDAKEVLEAEFSLVASVILDPRTIDRVSGIIDGSDFGLYAHRRAWDALCDLRAAGGPCSDSRQVVAMFSRLGILDALGGPRRLQDMRTVFAHNAVYYANIVKQGSQWRMLDGLLSKTRTHLEKTCDAADVAGWLRGQLDAIASGTTGVLQPIGDAAQEALDQILQAKNTGTKTGVTTGLPCFDEFFGGLSNGELVLLAARPSIGKTALAVQIAIHAARHHGPVMLASLEMKGRDLAMRMMAKATSISVRDLRRGEVINGDVDKLTRCVDELKQTEINLLYSRQVTAEKIAGGARLQASLSGISMVVVDYIGLVKSSDPRKSTYDRVSESCAAMKDLALELDVPVLCLSQLNRVAEKEKPGIHHLRDSGNLEQDADVIWLLYREDRQSTNAELHVAKARQGATGKHELLFDPATTTFNETTVRQHPNYNGEFREYEGSADDTGYF